MKKEILVRLKLAAEDFARGVKSGFAEVEAEAEKAGADASEGFERGFSSRKAALIAAVGAAGVAAVQAIKQSLDLAADLDTTSKQLGIGVEALQTWRYAAQKAGVSASELDGNVADLTRRIGEANAGSKSAVNAFADLGVGFANTTGQARSTEAVLVDVAGRLVEITDPSERVRLGTQLLGEEFYKLEPLLAEAASGFRSTTAELSQFGGVLSSEEIQNLQETNAKIEQMKTVLSIKIASVVAENSDAIIRLTSAAAGLAAQAIQTADAWLTMSNVLNSRDSHRIKISNYLEGREDLSPATRREAEAIAMRRFDARNGVRSEVTGSYLGGLVKTRRYDVREDGSFSDFDYLTDKEQNDLQRWLQPGGITPGTVAIPKPVSSGGGRRTPGVGGGSRRSGLSAAEREEQRAAKEAVRNEEQFREAVERTLKVQEDALAVEQVRADLGEVAAAEEKARLDFLRQYPLAGAETVEALAAQLGITRELTKEDRDRLGLLIQQANVAESTAVMTAGDEAQQKEIKAEKERAEREKEAAERQAEILRREHEAAIMNVADLYQDLFTDGIDGVWDHFEKEGTRIIAEIAAQWTLALISGQQFSLGSAAQDALGRSPLASLFGRVGQGAANDNGGFADIVSKTAAKAAAGGGGVDPATGQIVVQGQQGGGVQGTINSLGQAGGPIGLYAAAVTVSNMIGKGVSDLLGIEYSNTGGALFGALGGIIGGAIKSTKRGSAIIGDGGGVLGVTGFYGNSSSRKDAASGSANTLISSLYDIANALGATVDPSRGKVSIGVRKDSINVDPQGRGFTKTSLGAVAFGQDEQAAIEFAIRDLIKDGVLGGISRASQNILQSGQDLEQAIEKAVLIESIPKLLKQRLDPLGATLDDLYDKFKQLADALKEGSANAEQIAQARQLWELEKSDAIAAVGAASGELKDFLLSLTAGSNSPLALRQQRVTAEAELAPFIAQIEAAKAARAEADRLRASGASESEITAADEAARAAAGKIDQSGFNEAGQLLLGIDRAIKASGPGFFDTFDRIRNLTTTAIGLVDGATTQPDTTRDPFAELTAANTTDMVNLLVDQNDLLRELVRNFSGGGFGGGGGGGGGSSTDIDMFFGSSRAFKIAA